jgi:hypothetical protein
MHHAGVSTARATELLVEHKGKLRAIVGDIAGETEDASAADGAR